MAPKAFASSADLATKEQTLEIPADLKPSDARPDFLRDEHMWPLIAAACQATTLPSFWRWIEYQPGEFNWAPLDRIMDFAEQHKMQVKSFALYWGGIGSVPGASPQASSASDRACASVTSRPPGSRVGTAPASSAPRSPARRGIHASRAPDRCARRTAADPAPPAAHSNGPTDSTSQHGASGSRPTPANPLAGQPSPGTHLN